MKHCNTLLKDEKKTKQKRLMKQHEKVTAQSQKELQFKKEQSYPAKGIGSDLARNKELT